MAMAEAKSRKKSQISSSPLKGTDIFWDNALAAGRWCKEMRKRFRTLAKLKNLRVVTCSRRPHRQERNYLIKSGIGENSD